MTAKGLRGLLSSSTGPAIGTWLSIGSPYAVEVVASVGFDWFCVDMQHGLAGDDMLPAMLIAAAATGTPTVVRTRWNEQSAINRALDLGAAGVIVPLVNDQDAASRAARASRYPPLGERSWGRLRPMTVAQPGDADDDEPLCVVMIETPQAITALPQIAATPGLDGLFVGPSDLSLSVSGRLGADLSQHTAPVARSCQENGLVAGIACGTAEAVVTAHRAGFRLLTLSWDVAMLAAGARTAIDSARTALAALRNTTED
jgi:4-hydroxy-2-oxoheptanedioate aldolase